VIKVLVIDNYDSFTYNLVHYIESIHNYKTDVVRNDQITLDEIKKYDKILMSPGPGIPSEAGICLSMIKNFASEKSIMGVCLGHQAIGEAFGGNLTNLSEVYHGISTKMTIIETNEPLFIELPREFEAGRYHSWVVDNQQVPDELTVTCRDEHGMIMGLSHKKFDVRGVQFHPESVLTQHGLKIMENWLKH